MAVDVKLVGLDFGTTTSSAVIASAQLTRNSVTGRSELADVRETYCSDLVFTPFSDDRLDEIALARCLDEWLAAGQIDPDEVFGGGALLTGLAAEQTNAPAVVRTIRRRLKNALIATADDPGLESWLAFMGSCAGLSRAHPVVPIVNLDIGGGTTNIALGTAGNVLRTGCLHVGARHIQVTPGSYRICRLSRYAQELLAELRIAKTIDDCLTDAEVQAILAYYMSLLTAAIDGDSDRSRNRVARLHEVRPFRAPRDADNVVVTVSGGVGALIYSHLSGAGWPSTTCFGDLGIDFAKMLVSSQWGEHFREFVPQSAGRATVYGLLRHNTEVSGSTLFLPNPESLPLTDVPILGTIASHSTDEEIDSLMSLMRTSHRGACACIELSADDGPSVRSLAQRISRSLKENAFPVAQPLVLLVTENVGKVLGHYITEWGSLPWNLVVIDELAVRHAQYIRIGRVHEQVVPVSFYGLHDE
jgi:ethanolamine utilization protein EutA